MIHLSKAFGREQICMQGDIAFIITESNNDSDFNSCMKMYACINAHERNSFSRPAIEKKLNWRESTKELNSFSLMKVLGSYVSWDTIAELYLYVYAYICVYTNFDRTKLCVCVCTCKCVCDNSIQILKFINRSISLLWLSVF